jgi:hypothetical protein
MQRLKSVMSWLPFFVALAVVASAFILLLLILVFGWGSPRVVYWLAYDATKFHSDWIAMAIVLFLVSAFIYACIEIILHLSKSQNPAHNRIAASVFLTFIASLVLCGVSGVAWLKGGFSSVVNHVEAVRMNDHVYHLHFSSSDASEGYNDFYYLYECDSLDFLCQSIYMVPRTTGGIVPDVTTIHFLPDPATNTLSLEINGEVVYTHQPS